MSHSASAVESRASERRRATVVTLACLIGFLVLLAAAGAWRWAGVEKVAEVGASVTIPGGTVRMDAIEHAEPDELGAALPDGSHAVRVDLTVWADEQAPTIVSADDFTIEGTGITTPIRVSRAEPRDATVPRGGSVPLILMFAVPDDSTGLVLSVPGGGLITADHDDHPGDRLE